MSKIYTKTTGEGQPLVLLHGWGFHSAVFDDIADKLWPDYAVMQIDLPGFGHSAPLPAGAGLDEYTHSVAEHIPNNSIVMGWSFGGSVATYIAKHYPEKVQRLLTICSSPKLVGDDNWPGVKLAQLEQMQQGLMKDFAKTLDMFLVLQTMNLPNQKALVAELKAELLTPAPDQQALQDTLAILQTMDIRDQLKDIQCPVHCCYGELDKVNPSAVSENITQYHNNIDTHVFAHATHVPFLTHPDEFMQWFKQCVN
jgi:pimeloyl-[acyl-carrier protein] methyl ester esterase